MSCFLFRIHDDVIKWKHFPRNWPFVRKIHRSPVNFPHKGQWRGALMFSLIYVWINDWANNREAGDLRRQHGHYDVIVMVWCVHLWVASVLTHLGVIVCTSFNEILIKMQNFSFTKMHIRISSAKWRTFGPRGDQLKILWVHHFFTVHAAMTAPGFIEGEWRIYASVI